MFCCKVHESGDDKILAVCDADLIGKTISHHDGVELHVNPSFYGHEKCDASSLLKIAKRATIINALGNQVIDLFIREKIVDEKSVIKIGKIMHAQVVCIL